MNEDGKWKASRREPRPDYALRCFVVVRSALQFHQAAHFDEKAPIVDEFAYRRLIKRVVKTNPRKAPVAKRVTIPGYADLKAFSRAHEDLLKEECGGAVQSYLQRGNWRMVLPFSKRHQFRTAQRIYEEVGKDEPAILHLVRFPSLAINHAVLVYGAHRESGELLFDAYDPNDPENPISLTFDATRREFKLPRNNYFIGGRVAAYQVYHHWAY